MKAHVTRTPDVNGAGYLYWACCGACAWLGPTHRAEAYARLDAGTHDDTHHTDDNQGALFG